MKALENIGVVVFEFVKNPRRPLERCDYGTEGLPPKLILKGIPSPSSVPFLALIK